MRAPTMSYCQAENGINDFIQKIPNYIKVACSEVTGCSGIAMVLAWGSVEKHSFGSTPAFISHLSCGDRES